MFRLTVFLKNYKKQLIFGPAFKLTEAIFELIVPLVMADIIDNGIGYGNSGYILRMGAVLVMLGAVGLGCALVCQIYASQASQGVGGEIRTALYRHITSLSHSELDALGTSSRSQRMTSDINAVQLSVAMLIRLVIRAPFLAAGAIVMAILIDLRLSLIFLAVTPAIALILYFVMSRSVPFFAEIQKNLDKISLITRENLSGTRVIRAFSAQKRESSRFTDACENHAKLAVRVGRISALLNPLTAVLMNAGILMLLHFGAIRVNSGSLTQGQLIALINYMNQILLALIVIANVVVIFTKASASAARINEVFDMKPSITDPASDKIEPTDASSPAVVFDNVSFGYGNGNKYVLKNISLTINRGQKIGIIGGTGSGKSTLISLIPRFYDTDSGCVRVFGADVRCQKLEFLRSKIGIVPQKASVMSGTVSDNLRFGNAAADDAALWKALETAQAKDFVYAMPGGLSAHIEQNGRNLSGGQRQRITIARAVAMKPELLILDDSTSALDASTDLALRRAISSEFENLTVIMASQRAASIRDADMIVVLDSGLLVGIGNHEQLYETCEIYREICDSQSQTGAEGGII